MPFLKIQTNQSVSGERACMLADQASRLVADQLGKPERYVMVLIEQGSVMRFAGSDAPLAYLELKSIGLPETATAQISRSLCDFIGDALNIDADRIYIEFSDAPRKMWGWNGGTF
jgi:phenylpyruvate tautomerase